MVIESFYPEMIRRLGNVYGSVLQSLYYFCHLHILATTQRPGMQTVVTSTMNVLRKLPKVAAAINPIIKKIECHLAGSDWLSMSESF